MISVVIPTLNEADRINATIAHLFVQAANVQDLEVIVVDAGSYDQTLDKIENDKVLKYNRPDFALKKYKSLNYGLEKSSGEIVIFLDADTLLPRHFDELITSSLENPKVVGGAFEFSFLKPDLKLRILTLINRVRYRLDRAYYGDQAIFARRPILDQIGGVPNEALMEAAYLCRALRREGRLKLVRPGIQTSPRRFDNFGFFKVFWFDMNMFIRFNLGLSVSDYANRYWGKNLTHK